MTVSPPEPLAIDHGGPVDCPFEPFPDSALQGSISDRFDAIAARYPDALAVQDLERRLTYRQLAGTVEAIAAAVSAAGRSGPVAILLNHDARYPAALLGVLAAGRIAVPLDVDHPRDRNRLIAEHAGATLVVSAGLLAAQARELFPANLTVLDVEALDFTARAPRAARPGPEDIAYILYTSGSTGAPKGVVHDHRTALNDTLLTTNTAHLSCDDRMVIFYSGVIGGIRNLLGALLNGASLNVLPPQLLQADGIVREIRARGVTIYQSVPTLFRRVVQALEPGERMDTVRLVRLTGDWVEWSDFDAFRGAFSPTAVFCVAIGSTECSSTYANWFVDETVREAGAKIPVGRVVPGLRLTVVDDDGRDLDDGEVGEFVVASPFLARGYWRAPDLTAERFRTDPASPGGQIFSTGDMGLRRPDGLLEFAGRKDGMVKLRGHRIELAEVEAALRACSGVKDAVLVVRRHASGVPRSVTAYVELEDGIRGLLPRHLLAMMSRRLPRYMLPARVEIVPALPRLPNFKVDRTALVQLEASAAPPDDPVTARAMEVFARVIEVGDVTPNDNLLSLGGDSLQAVSLLLELETEFRIRIPVDVFQQSQSIGELARYIDERSRRPRRNKLVEPAPDDTAPSSDELERLARDVSAALDRGLMPALPERSLAWLRTSALGLIDMGRLDLGEAFVRRMHAADPAADWPGTMTFLFDHLPSARSGEPDLVDRGTSDVQVMRRDNDTVLLAFCGKGGRIGLPLPMMNRWMGLTNASVVYLRDLGRHHYLGGVASLAEGRAATLDALRRIMGELGGRRLICFGNSAGAFGALGYGLALEAEAVLCTAGLVNLEPEFNTYLRYATQARIAREAFPEAALDLRQALEESPRPPRTMLVYGERNWDDRQQAESLAGTSATLIPLADTEGHSIVPRMIDLGLFGELLQQLGS